MENLYIRCTGIEISSRDHFVVKTNRPINLEHGNIIPQMTKFLQEFEKNYECALINYAGMSVNPQRIENSSNSINFIKL